MFIIPMAGLSSRFFKAGFNKPKYMLTLNGKSIFYHAVNSFNKYFNSDLFVFIYRDMFNTEEFILNEIEKIGIKKFQLVKLCSSTNGQAETVFKGINELSNIDDEELNIFNIDTFRPNFLKPNLSNSKGYLEVFKGSGRNWSNIIVNESGDVVETAEKKEISDLCCTGLYNFSSITLYKSLYIEYQANEKVKELYIAPMYNYLIKRRERVGYSLIKNDEVVFCGTPLEYESLINDKNI